MISELQTLSATPFPWTVAVSLCVNVIALAYGYGVLNSRVKTLQKSHDENLVRNTKVDDEIFTRLRKIEGVTPRLEDAAARLERILSNGVTGQVRDLTERLTRLEQHCKDLHDRRPPDST